MKTKVYVDDGVLLTELGVRIRKATLKEIEDSKSTYEGYVETPDDVIELLTLDHDGQTVLVEKLKMDLYFQDICINAGFNPGADGKMNLPATQETADKLASAAVSLLPVWVPGAVPIHITLTGPGPVWGYLAIAHALHGRVVELSYAAPNADKIKIFGHGV